MLPKHSNISGQIQDILDCLGSERKYTSQYGSTINHINHSTLVVVSRSAVVLISKTGDSTTTRSHRSRNRKAARVFSNNYNGDWTACSHPDVMTEMYVKNFVISYTIYTFVTIMRNVLTNWSSSSANNIV